MASKGSNLPTSSSSGRQPQSMASTLKIHHNKSIHDEHYAKLLKKYDWHSNLPPRGYVFGVGRGATPLNSSNEGVAVGAGAKGDHGGLTASQLSYFDALDAVDSNNRQKVRAAIVETTATANVANTGEDKPHHVFSMEALATVERVKVGKVQKNSLRDEEAGALAEEVFFADDAGAEGGLDRMARKRLLGQLAAATGAQQGGSGNTNNSILDGAAVASSSSAQQRPPVLSHERLEEILSTGDERKAETWILRSRALFESQESFDASVNTSADGAASSITVGTRSTVESIRVLEKGIRKHKHIATSEDEGAHVWREMLFATVGWGPYCDDIITSTNTTIAAAFTSTDGDNANSPHFSTHSASISAARRSRRSLDLLKGLQNPSLYRIPLVFIPKARAVVAEAVEHCPHAIELWTYAIALQATEMGACTQTQAALEANPTCVPLYRFMLEQIAPSAAVATQSGDATDDANNADDANTNASHHTSSSSSVALSAADAVAARIALVRAGIERNPFSADMLELASLVFEQQGTAEGIAEARKVFLTAAGRFAKEKRQAPSREIMLAAIALEDREVNGRLKRAAKGSGLTRIPFQNHNNNSFDGDASASSPSRVMPWLATVAVSSATPSSSSSSSSAFSPALRHLFSMLGGGAVTMAGGAPSPNSMGSHALAKIVAKTAKLHLIDAINQRTADAAFLKGLLEKERRIREQPQQQHQQPNPLFADYGLPEIKELLSLVGRAIVVKDYVISEWIENAITMAARGYVLAGAMMLRELLKYQSGEPFVFPEAKALSDAAAAGGGGSAASSPPSIIMDFSSISFSWCGVFMTMCLKKYEGRDAASKHLLTLKALVEAARQSEASPAAPTAAPNVAALVEQMAKEKRIEHRTNAFISQVLHAQREKKRLAKRGEEQPQQQQTATFGNIDGVTVKSEFPQQSKEASGMSDDDNDDDEDVAEANANAASDALFGCDAEDEPSSSRHYASDKKATLAQPPNVEALVALMLWILSVIAASSVAELSTSSTAQYANAAASSSSATTATNTTTTTTTHQLDGGEDHTFGIGDDYANRLGDAKSHHRRGRREDRTSSGTDNAAASLNASSPTLISHHRRFDFDFMLDANTSIEVIAGLIQTVVKEVGTSMKLKLSEKSHSHIALSALSKRSRELARMRNNSAGNGGGPHLNGGGAYSIQKLLDAISDAVEMLRQHLGASDSTSAISSTNLVTRELFSCASGNGNNASLLGKFLHFLLRTTNDAILARSARSARTLLAYCAWGGGKANDVLSLAALTAKNGLLAAQHQHLTHQRNKQQQGGGVKDEEEGDNANNGTVAAAAAGAAVDDGEEKDIQFYVPPPQLLSALSGGAGASIGPLWTDVHCSPTPVPLYNSTPLEGIAHYYVKVDGAGFAPSSSAPSSAPSSSLTSIDYFGNVLNDLQSIGSYGRVVSALFSDGGFFSDALCVLTQPLALLTRLAYLIPLQGHTVSPAEEEEILASLQTASEMRYGSRNRRGGGGGAAEGEGSGEQQQQSEEDRRIALATQHIIGLLRSRRTETLDRLVPFIVSAVESLLLHAATLLQQSIDAQIDLYKAADALMKSLNAVMGALVEQLSVAATATSSSPSAASSAFDSAAGNAGGDATILLRTAMRVATPLLKHLHRASGRIESLQRDSIYLSNTAAQQQSPSSGSAAASSGAAVGEVVTGASSSSFSSSTAAVMASNLLPPLVANLHSIRCLLNAFLLPTLGQDLSARLSLFVEQHGLTSTVDASERIRRILLSQQHAEQSMSTSAASSVDVSIVIANNVSAATGAGGVGSLVVGSAASMSASPSAIDTFEKLIAAALKVSTWRSIVGSSMAANTTTTDSGSLSLTTTTTTGTLSPHLQLPPAWQSTATLLVQSRLASTDVMMSPPSSVTASEGTSNNTASDASNAAPYTSSPSLPSSAAIAPVLPLHLWTLLRSERLWAHRALVERYVDCNTAVAAILGVAGRHHFGGNSDGHSGSGSGSGGGMGGGPLFDTLTNLQASFSANSASLHALSASFASAVLQCVANGGVMVAAAGKGGGGGRRVTTASLDFIRKLSATTVRNVGFTIAHCSSNANGLKNALAHHQQRMQMQSASASSAATAAVSLQPSSLEALLATATIGRSVHNRTLWSVRVGAAVRALELAKKRTGASGGKGNTSKFSGGGKSSSASGPAGSGRYINPLSSLLASAMEGGGSATREGIMARGGGGGAGGNSRSSTSAQIDALTAALRAICEDAKKYCPLGPSLPRPIETALRLAGGQMSSFAAFAIEPQQDKQSNSSAANGSSSSLAAELFGGGASSSSSAMTMFGAASSAGNTTLPQISDEAFLANALQSVSVVGSAASTSLMLMLESTALWSSAIALDAFAVSLGDPQAARGALDQAEKFLNQYLEKADQKRSEVEGRIVNIQKQFEKDAQREQLVAKGRGEFNKAAALQLMREKRSQMFSSSQQQQGGGGGGEHDSKKRCEDEMTFLLAVKQHITDPVFFKLLKGIFTIVNTRLMLEKIKVLGTERHAYCSYLLPARLPPNVGGTTLSSPPPPPLLAHEGIAGLVSNASSSVLSLSSSVSHFSLPSSVHREPLSLVKMVTTSSITTLMSDITKTFVTLQRGQGGGAVPNMITNTNGSIFATFTDYVSFLGIEGMCEVAAALIDLEVPRERGIAVATVMNRLHARHPATFLSVAKLFWNHLKFAECAEEVLKALDATSSSLTTSSSSSLTTSSSPLSCCDAWLMVVFTMQECQRLLAEALQSFADEILLASSHADDAEATNTTTSSSTRPPTTLTSLRLASARFTSSVEWIAEHLVRPYVNQFFGGSSTVAGLVDTSTAAGGAGAASSVMTDFSAQLLPDNYASVGLSAKDVLLFDSSVHGGGGANVALPQEAIARALGAHETVVVIVGTAVEACCVVAIRHSTMAMGHDRSVQIQKNGGFSLVNHQNSSGNRSGSASSFYKGPIWRYITEKRSKAVCAMATTGSQLGPDVVIEDAVNLFTITSTK